MAAGLLFAGILALFLQAGSIKAAEYKIPAKGIDGKCAWSIDSKGTLTIKINGDYEGNGEPVLWPVSSMGQECFVRGFLVPEWCNYRENIKKVKIKKGKGKLTKTTAMFFALRVAPENYDIKQLDTSKVTDMGCMFRESAGVPSLKGLSTAKLKSMRGMFWMTYFPDSSKNCLKGFDTSKVTDMSYLFCGSYQKLPDLKGFNTSSVTNMSYMFGGLTLTEAEQKQINALDTRKATDMSYMFSGVKADKLSLKGLKTEKATDMSGMFRGCSKLLSLDISGFDTTNVKNMDYMFENCSSLSELDLSSFSMKQTKDMSMMFYGCSALKKLFIDPEKWENMEGLNRGLTDTFKGCGLSYAEKFQEYLEKQYMYNRYGEEGGTPCPVMTDYFTPQTK